MNKVKSNNKITPGSCEQSGLARDAVEVCVPEESGPIESETASKVRNFVIQFTCCDIFIYVLVVSNNMGSISKGM